MSEEKLSNLIEATDESLAAEINKPELTFVDFWATWCGPCRILGPMLEDLAKNNPNIRVVKLDVDANQQSAMKYQVFSIPTVRVFKNGQEIGDPIVGVQKPEVYQEIVSKYSEAEDKAA